MWKELHWSDAYLPLKRHQRTAFENGQSNPGPHYPYSN